MGYELRRQLREVLGPNITGLQRAVALEIADDANEDTRESWAALEDLARWTGAKDVNVVRNALKRLGAAGWEFRVPIGKGKDGRLLYAVPGHRMTYKVPHFEGVAPALPSTQGVATAPSEGAGATSSAPQGGAGAPTQGATAPSEGAVATPFSSYLNPSEVLNEYGGQGGAEATPSSGGAPRDYQLKKFWAFWTVYPRKKQQEKAREAWCAALDRGADPEQIITAATAYAFERQHADHTYTPYPANWLDKGSYADEPDPQPPAAAQQRTSHRFQPRTTPTDLTPEEERNALNFA
ncbi:hypothetical protein [Streptomyces harbinensis]|uniref:hypothetical protein n=1 Tax=Streptomyces harbinensis TaxID=1176198 RepID=UPI0036BF1FE7